MAKSSAQVDVPEYPETTISSNGLFGTGTSNKDGFSYAPSDFETKLVNFSKNNALQNLQEYLNPNYDSEAFHQSDAYYTNKLNNVLQNEYLNGALQQNLLRGSTAADTMRGFANDLANTEYERQRDYKNQQLANYQAAMLPYATAYDVYSGIAQMGERAGQNRANYGLQNYALLNAKANQSSGLGSILGSTGSLLGGAGSMLGGASKLGGIFGSTGNAADMSSNLGGSLGGSILGSSDIDGAGFSVLDSNSISNLYRGLR